MPGGMTGWPSPPTRPVMGYSTMVAMSPCALRSVIFRTLISIGGGGSGSMPGASAAPGSVAAYWRVVSLAIWIRSAFHRFTPC
jgi:hypothetical protein